MKQFVLSRKKLKLQSNSYNVVLTLIATAITSSNFYDVIKHIVGQSKNILIECNEAYGVVRGGGGGGGGVSQSVELKDNAAYSAVNVHTAHNQSTTMDISTAYEVISDHVYENPNIQI